MQLNDVRIEIVPRGRSVGEGMRLSDDYSTNKAEQKFKKAIRLAAKVAQVGGTGQYWPVD